MFLEITKNAHSSNFYVVFDYNLQLWILTMIVRHAIDYYYFIRNIRVNWFDSIANLQIINSEKDDPGKMGGSNP